MKKSVKSAVLGAVAKTVLESAKRACGAASRWETYQPKEPETLKRLVK
ncbi:MAG: cyclic lactone autoinducer peptide [Ruminiclostridium sp.]|jgi:cyclic lactone autoinducer peptide|nr:cyclic lactone autoinducer peptide [Ruminiclostridium sp.]